jgi:hypothetical protein
MPNITHRRRTLCAVASVMLSLSSSVLAAQADTKALMQRIDRLEAALQAEDGICAVKRRQYTNDHRLPTND